MTSISLDKRWEASTLQTLTVIKRETVNLKRLLIHSLSELPVLAKGKGIKIISIPAARVVGREEFVQRVSSPFFGRYSFPKCRY